MLTEEKEISNSSSNSRGEKKRDVDASPGRISVLAGLMEKQINGSIKAIGNINLQTKLLATNGQVEASRSGENGRAFSVIAEEMISLAGKTSQVAHGLISETKAALSELLEISDKLGKNVLGTRLSDLALNNIDLVDRNLYERTCDVRWWATDSSIVTAAASGQPDDCDYASRRMGVILDAYTVYFDLVLCDTKGNVIANGRPGEYESERTNQFDTEWFQAVINSISGNEYGFQSVHSSELVNGENVLVYSCSVREGGEATGRIVGVLGVLFRYDDLAQTIVKNTPLSEAEKKVTRVCFTNGDRLMIADTQGRILEDTVDFEGIAKMLNSSKSYQLAK